ncbi:glycosyltransferase family 4 protein [Luteolibacter sp. SL250]|uniref:glycosyltransferase family 4 protein n=1 Tax=Luteolibacter sp. SL250 TaxID=2995170 RepID=UPI00226E0D9C|nr:glycosyltransferase family 4 protein [Luteolibacter sp. SL250]WAC19812.1 glycosyltransferase family 4 protein [Luteolibacter sp. SL250]
MDTIIHTEASHGWGGQEMRILTECRWFRAQGFRCLLLAKGDSPLAEHFRREGFDVLPVPFKRGSQLRDFMACLRIFRKLKPALVATHSNIDSRVALAAATAAGVKRRVRYRHVSIPVRTSPWNQVIYRRFATGVVTTSRSISDELYRGFKLRKDAIRSVPTGVVSSPKDHNAHDEIRSRLGLPRNARIICQVSILRSWKGHVHLLDAFGLAAAGRPDLHLVIVGDGNMGTELRKKAGAMEVSRRIHFTGHVEDPYPWFQAADIMTLASTGGEGVPQSALQAFACGKPFVGTTVGGIPDIVRHEVNGLLVPPADPQAMADAFARLLDDDRFAATLGMEAERTFDACGSVDHMGESLRRFLNL